MAGQIFDDINPNIVSGVQLANILNSFKDAYASKTKQSTRPNNLLAGGTWVDDSLEVSNSVLRFMLYDGVTDLELLRVNKTTGAVTVSKVEGLLSILKSSDDAFGSSLELIKRRKTGNAKTQNGDEIGALNFKGVDDALVEYVSSRIRVLATEDFTSSTQGSEIAIGTTQTGTTALVERVRIKNDGKVGFGTNSPDNLVHLKKQSNTALKVEQETDDASSPALIVKKARISGSGQVLTNDSVGKISFNGEESDGTEAELVRIESFATENIDGGAHGSKLVISTKDNSTNTFSEKIVIDSTGVTINGSKQNDTNTTLAMAHDGLTQPLFSIDSSQFGAFTAEFYANGSSIDTRSTRYVLKAVWNGANWDYEIETEGMLGSDKVIDPVITNASVFVCEYDNLLDQANFVSGKIYLKITKFGA